jgi:hypothetical protein
MYLHQSKVIILVLFVSLAGQAADLITRTTVKVALDGQDFPASDLLDPRSGRILSPQEAWLLKTQEKIDLSRLEPDDSTDLWEKTSTQNEAQVDQQLLINENEQVLFQGFLKSSAGRARFNVQVKAADQTLRTLTLMVSEELHTTLLRKELLRRLGYHIPAMKFLPKIRLRFADKFTRDAFFPNLTNSTYGAASRWFPDYTPESAGETLEFVMQDVVAMAATPLIYNVAMGAPVSVDSGGNLIPLGQRILRSLSIVYGLLNISESVNQVEWYFGLIRNQFLNFSVPDLANFSATRDDAAWMARKISSLSRADFTEIVRGSYFPPAVEKLLIEKLIARRNSLLELLKLDPQALPFDSQVNLAPDLISGKLVKTEWQGFASRFAHDPQKSPLNDIWYYVVSQLESNALGNLIGLANQQWPSLTVGDANEKHQQALYDAAIQQFLKTGTTNATRFGAWAAPVASGGVDLTRDVVIGSYMGTGDGTSNMVQMADTFGFHLTAGMMIGFDGVTATQIPGQLLGMVNGSVNLSFSHLKPLQSLKQIFKEPFSKTIVPWLIYQSSSLFKDMADVQKITEQLTTEEIQKKMADYMEKLEQYLDVGESIIITESISSSQSLSSTLTGPSLITPAVSARVGTNEMVLWRLHLYRKSRDTIQIFKDNGALIGANIEARFSAGAAYAQFPILTLRAQNVTGSAETRFYTVNVDSDPVTNPKIYSQAAALVSLLRSQSVEALEEQQKATVLTTTFADQNRWVQFLAFVHRSMRSNGSTLVQLPDGNQARFISLSEGKQFGVSFQSLATQALNFVIQWFSKSSDYGIDTSPSPNPGQTFMGFSTTRKVSFQSAVNDEGLDSPFIKVTYRWQGWDAKIDKLKKLTKKLGEKYGFILYPEGFLQNTTDVQLYNVSLNVNLYESSIRKVMSLSSAELKKITQKYNQIYACNSTGATPEGGSVASAEVDKCQAIKKFSKALAAYNPQKKGSLSLFFSYMAVSTSVRQFAQFLNSWKSTSDVALSSQAILEAVSSLEKFSTFEDFITIIGGTEHMYIDSSINGFRRGAEQLSEPVYSNTFGKIDPDHPGGPLDTAQAILGIESGEFDGLWMRNQL